MASATDSAIAESIIEDLQRRASEQGFRALLAGDELAGQTANGFHFKSDSDHESVIYSTDSGEPRIIPTVYLAKTLQKRRGGQKAFVPADPATGLPIGAIPEYQLGEFMCFLHPDHPKRAELVEMGIGPEVICGDHETAPAAHIANEFNLKLHESHKHPISFKIREEYLAKKTAKEEREERRQQTAAMMALAQSRAPRGAA